LEHTTNSTLQLRTVQYSSFFLPCEPRRDYQLLYHHLTTDLAFCAERKYTRSKQYSYSVERYICRLRPAASAYNARAPPKTRKAAHHDPTIPSSRENGAVALSESTVPFTTLRSAPLESSRRWHHELLHVSLDARPLEDALDVHFGKSGPQKKYIVISSSC
jgi:hypothetical protein